LTVSPVGKRAVDGFTVLTLSSAAVGGIEVAFVPEAGMVGCSLRHRGEELLGQRGGLATYVARRSTMGIPFLHPWANRVGAMRFEVAGREVVLDSGEARPSLDPSGLPMHGLLSAAPGWRVERHEAAGDDAVLAATFDFAAHGGLMAAFPFPHEIRLEAALAENALSITTTIRPTGEVAVPISFGYHPYFRLPGVARSEWLVEIPVRERLTLDERMLPTGERLPVQIGAGPLGSRTFDDAYLAPPGSAPLVLAGGGRRIEVSFGPGYPYAQVYAPDDDDVIALEPMTAPTNALVTGGPELPLVEPGGSFDATFTITIA
jgi:galactose mutarotase-like enzyme